MKRSVIAATFAALFLNGCDSAVTNSETSGAAHHLVDTSIANLASQLNVEYQLVENYLASDEIDCAQLAAEFATCSMAIFSMSTDQTLKVEKGWSLFAHSVRRILALKTPGWTVEHITGDLHRITPPQDFKQFAAGEPIELKLVIEHAQLFETDIMPNWYLVSAAGEASVIAQMATENVRDFIKPFEGEEWRAGAGDQNILMTASSRYERNLDVQPMAKSEVANLIIPTPLSQTFANGELELPAIVITDTANLGERFGLKAKLAAKAIPVASEGVALALRIDDSMPLESYRLEVGDQIKVVAGSRQGVIWGVQSMLASITDGKIAKMIIEDSPRYAYRGMQVDLARNHRSLAVLKRLVTQMSSIKLNKLHLGLTNDEGWRIEINGLPELTEVGAKRCHDLAESRCLLPQLGSGPDTHNMGSGFLSADQYVELVRHADDHGIEVIPEINMPAHARAAVVAMEARYNRLLKAGDIDAANEYRLSDPDDLTQATSVQFYDRMSFINPCLQSSHRFVNKVMTEVVALHNRAGQPLNTWHYGGDEAKNIKLGAGFEDVDAASKEGGKGLIELANEDHPFGRSPACNKLIEAGDIASVKELPAWFAVKVGDMVTERAISNFQAWQDGLKYAKGADQFSNNSVIVNYWETVAWGASDTLGGWSDKGFQVVLSSPDFLYFDFPYEVHPQERGYYWAARFVDLKRVYGFSPDNMAQNAETTLDRNGVGFRATSRGAGVNPIGISGQQWGETVRTDQQFEYMVYPRIFALAERAWHKAAFELPQQDGQAFGPESTFVDTQLVAEGYQRFANIVANKYLPQLEAAGIHYRLPVPGATRQDDGYRLNTELPGVTLQANVKGVWQLVEQGIAPIDAKAVRAVQFDGRRVGRAQPLN